MLKTNYNNRNNFIVVMFNSSLQARSLIDKIEHKISAEKKHRAKLPSFAMQSQNQIFSTIMTVENALRQRKRENQEISGRLEQTRQKTMFFGFVRKLEINQKLQNQTIPHKESDEVPVPVPKMNLVSKRKGQQKIVAKKVVKKVKLSQNKGLIAFYRYHIISLCALLNKKEDYFSTIRIKKSDILSMALSGAELEEKLKKQIESKGKDKGRQNFNIMGSDQLRSLKYKKKAIYTYNNPFKKDKNRDKTDDEMEEEVDQQSEQKEEKIDNATWRRRNGVRQNQRVFIIKGGYQDMRRALLDRGWFQNEDVWSPFYDFKWTTKINDVEFYRLSPHQIVNHFNNNQGLTSKFGLARNLRTLILGYNIDIDKFFPRCYDIGDLPDFQNFIENFKFGFAETVVRRFLVQPERYRNLELKLRIALDVLQRRNRQFADKIDLINTHNFFMISPEEWGILTETSELPETNLAERLKLYRKDEQENPQGQEYQAVLFCRFKERITTLLENLKQTDPQMELNGYHNIWIAKPNYLSRGRGIRCFNNLFDIVDYCFGKDIQYVVQKYIENPLIIMDRKFDIRQWVLIQDYNPPKVWFYEECYVRFCTELYSLQNINNRYIHLTNNSIQKHSSKFSKTDIPGNMWSMKEFSEHVGVQNWKIIQQKMKNIIVWSIKSCQGQIAARRNSCELVGYDFMIDEYLNPWLIEINMSPAMDYSTSITKRLVKSVMEDTVKVLVDSKKKKDTGMFNCIYRGESTEAYNIYKM